MRALDSAIGHGSSSVIIPAGPEQPRDRCQCLREQFVVAGIRQGQAAEVRPTDPTEGVMLTRLPILDRTRVVDQPHMQTYGGVLVHQHIEDDRVVWVDDDTQLLIQLPHKRPDAVLERLDVAAGQVPDIRHPAPGRMAVTQQQPIAIAKDRRHAVVVEHLIIVRLRAGRGVHLPRLPGSPARPPEIR